MCLRKQHPNNASGMDTHVADQAHVRTTTTTTRTTTRTTTTPPEVDLPPLIGADLAGVVRQVVA